MVYLSKIYTKTGDDGTTALGDGSRLRKDADRIEAYGTVDELNAVLGLMTSTSAVPVAELIQAISNDLFDVGADLCVPLSGHEAAGSVLRITGEHIQRIEAEIDRLNAKLTPLKSFILPGGTPAAAWCHLARTVCRRAERRVVTLAGKETVNPDVITYLNRLSDFLFVLARTLNNGGNDDVLWKPGAHRPAAE
jgi:cob(I)alamin adenosyltransferase